MWRRWWVVSHEGRLPDRHCFIPTTLSFLEKVVLPSGSHCLVSYLCWQTHWFLNVLSAYISVGIQTLTITHYTWLYPEHDPIYELCTNGVPTRASRITCVPRNYCLSHLRSTIVATTGQLNCKSITSRRVIRHTYTGPETFSGNRYHGISTYEI